MEDDDIEDAIDYLEDVGAFEWVGMDGDGERIPKPNMELIYQHYPELYDMLMSDLENTLMDLYKVGLVNVDYDEDLTPRFEISEEGKQYLNENGFGIY
jgi:hypothetical protein